MGLNSDGGRWGRRPEEDKESPEARRTDNAGWKHSKPAPAAERREAMAEATGTRSSLWK